MPPLVFLVFVVVGIIIFLLPILCQCKDDTSSADMIGNDETNPAIATVSAARTTTTTTTTTTNNNYNYNVNHPPMQRLPSVSEHIILATDVVRVTTSVSANANNKPETDGTVILVHMEPTTDTTTVNRNFNNTSTPMEC